MSAVEELVMPAITKVAPVRVVGVIPVELVYCQMFFWPEELVPSEVASDQPEAKEFTRVEEAAVIEPEAPLQPVGAVSPVAVVENTALTHLIVVLVTAEPVKV